MSTNSIGSFLAALRKASGMTQKQLAEKLNVSDKAVSRWERDECAPDLALIPVLAEIFGVTCDEILRGQRNNPDAEPPARSEEKTQKRLRHLLDQAETTYRVRSMISCLIAAVGLIAAMILNLGFLRACLGFLIGGIFFIGAAVCQAIFSVQCRAALNQEDFDPDAVQECRNSILRISQRAYSLIAVLFASTLPLLSVEDTYWGLSFHSWLTQGFLFALAAFLLSRIVCHIVNVRRGITAPINWKSALNKLRLRTCTILVLALAVTGILQLMFASWLSDNHALFSDVTRFDDWDSFKAYMETPIIADESLTFQSRGTDEYGLEILIYTDESGNECWYYPDHITESIYSSDGSLLCCRYERLNESVCYVSYSDTADRLPVYTQTRDQYTQASGRFSLFMLGWIPIYLTEAVIAVFVYRRKKATIE